MAGPLALPGNYQVRLTAGGKTLTAPLTVRLDPREKVSASDLEQQLDLALKVHDRLDQLNKTVNQLRSVRGQLQALQKQLAGRQQEADLVKSADALSKQLDPIEKALIDPSIQSSEDSLNYPIVLDAKLAVLETYLQSADSAPTSQSKALFDVLSRQLDDQLGKWNNWVGHDLVAFNQSVRKQNVPVVSLPATQSVEAAR